jgi:hypothetical protein
MPSRSCSNAAAAHAGALERFSGLAALSSPLHVVFVTQTLFPHTSFLPTQKLSHNPHVSPRSVDPAAVISPFS